MILKQENLKVRSALISDVKILTDWWNDGKVMEHAGFPLGINTNIEAVTEIVKRNTSSQSQLLILEIDDTPIGEANYRIKENIAEIGIKICDFTYQNRGLGTIYLKMMINYLFFDEAFQTINIEKIVLDTNLNNIRAQRVYEKLGFTKVRIRENAWKNQMGVLQSSVDYEMKKKNGL